MPLSLQGFVRKWNASQLTERAAAAQHFRDLCEVLDVPHPTQLDEIGASYTFEKHVTKGGTGDRGYADVWKRGFFAWEYKSKGGDLKAAYKQLIQYHDALDNPPLLIVSDFERFEVHTKFENSPSRVFPAMSEQDGIFGMYTIRCFNGGLFTDDFVIDLDRSRRVRPQAAYPHPPLQRPARVARQRPPRARRRRLCRLRLAQLPCQTGDPRPPPRLNCERAAANPPPAARRQPT